MSSDKIKIVLNICNFLSQDEYASENVKSLETIMRTLKIRAFYAFLEPRVVDEASERDSRGLQSQLTQGDRTQPPQ